MKKKMIVKIKRRNLVVLNALKLGNVKTRVHKDKKREAKNTHQE